MNTILASLPPFAPIVNIHATRIARSLKKLRIRPPMTLQALLPEVPNNTVLAFHRERAVTRAEFLSEVQALAAQIPLGVPLLNLCTDRYHFSLGLFAAILHGNLSLLPNALTLETINSLLAQYPNLLSLSDQPSPLFELPMLRVGAHDVAIDPSIATPQIPINQCVACVFTSGSSGVPQAHFKRWGSLNINAKAEADRLWAAAGGPCTVVGTVPSQHMYGLESAILMPMLGGGILCAQRPFYPGDVAAALASMPAPRMLVTTPFHLRALLDAELALPKLDLILSATAPLALSLAERAEHTFHAPVHEIYGATETGQLASRHTTAGETWHALGKIRLRQAGEQTLASGGHIEQETALNDIVELFDPQRFRLIGRNSDTINIAGKRSSLAFLNHVLTNLPGVRDGVFCLPNEEGEVMRLAAFVVAPGLSSDIIQHGLRAHLDPVFLPRPIVFVEVLPRNTTGKIPQEALQTLIATHLRKPH